MTNGLNFKRIRKKLTVRQKKNNLEIRFITFYRSILSCMIYLI